MSKHTPGPWKVGQLSGEILAGTESVAAAPECYEEETWQANAALIAASPELLDAARAVLQSREDGTFGPDGERGFKLLAEAVRKAETKR